MFVLDVLLNLHTQNVCGNTEKLKSLAEDLIERNKALKEYLDPNELGASDKAVRVLIK